MEVEDYELLKKDIRLTRKNIKFIEGKLSVALLQAALNNDDDSDEVRQCYANLEYLKDDLSMKEKIFYETQRELKNFKRRKPKLN